MKENTTNIIKTDNHLKVSYEELHIRHINLLIDIKNKNLNNWFLKMAIINTFDDLKIFLNNLKKNKNKCIIAINGNRIVGYLNIFPLNKKETCLKISAPKLINNCSLTERELTIGLIRKSISITDIKTSSWIIQSDVNNKELISSSRELGFQPSEEIKIWNLKNLDNSKKLDIEYNEIINEFQEINKNNLVSVVNFVRSNQSILIRNILDFDQKDIIKRNNPNCGALIYKNLVLCTILKDINYQNEDVYTLTISRYWDNKFNPTLKKIINKLLLKAPLSNLKTYNENFETNTSFEDFGLIEKSQEIILIRNTLVKNEVKQINKINQSLESIIEKLNPQGNPYPSPFPIRHK